MNSDFLSDLLQYVACFALTIASLGSLCTVIGYGIRGKVPYGEMKMLSGLFFISAALLCLSQFFGARAAKVGTLPVIHDPLSPYTNVFWACANIAASIGLMKVIDAFEHPERGLGMGWQYAAQVGELLSRYAAGKVSEREQRRTRAKWHECVRTGADGE